MMKRFCAMMLALALALTAVAALADEAETDTLLVTVNGREIRESDPLLQFWITYLLSQNDVQTTEELIQLYQEAMAYSVNYALLEQDLDSQGKNVTEDEIALHDSEAQTQWDEAVDSIMRSEFGISDDSSEEDKTAARADAIAYILTNYGYTEESYLAENREYIKLMLLSNRYSEIAAEGVEVSDQDVEDYFNTLVEQSRQLVGDDAAAYEFYSLYYGYESKYIPEGFRGITHILLEADEELLNTWKDLADRLEEQNKAETENTDSESTEETAEPEEPVTQEMVDAAKQAILDSVQDIIDEIKEKLEAGVEFEDLILEYGTDPGMQDEETRANGYAVHADSIMWDPDFQKGAMELANIGDVSDPIVSGFGVHILKYLRDIPGGAVELTDTMKDAMREEILSNAISNRIAERINQITSEAEIVWTEAGEAWRIAEETTEE